MRATIHRRYLRLLLFVRNTRGVAAVEFALVLPFLLLLFLGSIEASSLLTVDRRINVITGTVGDLVARWDAGDGPIPSATLTDYFQAAQGIIYPYQTGPLKQVVTLVAVAANGATSVRWSCAYNGGTKKTVNATYPSLPAKMNEIARGGWVVASAVSYSYTPVLGMVFTEEIELYNESFYLPRFENEIVGPAC